VLLHAEDEYEDIQLSVTFTNYNAFWLNFLSSKQQDELDLCLKCELLVRG